MRAVFLFIIILCLAVAGVMTSPFWAVLFGIAGAAK